jgi:hypothetical protein
MPNGQGFDYYWGTLGANDRGIVAIHNNNTPEGEISDMGSLIRTYTDKSIDFLENKREKGKPFVLYLAHAMMHLRIDASPAFKASRLMAFTVTWLKNSTTKQDACWINSMNLD